MHKRVVTVVGEEESVDTLLLCITSFAAHVYVTIRIVCQSTYCTPLQYKQNDIKSVLISILDGIKTYRAMIIVYTQSFAKVTHIAILQVTDYELEGRCMQRRFDVHCNERSAYLVCHPRNCKRCSSRLPSAFRDIRATCTRHPLPARCGTSCNTNTTAI